MTIETTTGLRAKARKARTTFVAAVLDFILEHPLRTLRNTGRTLLIIATFVVVLIAAHELVVAINGLQQLISGVVGDVQGAFGG